MRTHVLRLKPGDDLKTGLEKFLGEKQIRAAVLLACVGSLSKVCLRFAGESEVTVFEGKHEIVSMEATLSVNGCHLHMSVANRNGLVIGGHVKEGNVVYTTAEVVIGEIEGLVFRRTMDDGTGYAELCVSGS